METDGQAPTMYLML